MNNNNRQILKKEFGTGNHNAANAGTRTSTGNNNQTRKVFLKINKCDKLAKTIRKISRFFAHLE